MLLLIMMWTIAGIAWAYPIAMLIVWVIEQVSDILDKAVFQVRSIVAIESDPMFQLNEIDGAGLCDGLSKCGYTTDELLEASKALAKAGDA